MPSCLHLWNAHCSIKTKQSPKIWLSCPVLIYSMCCRRKICGMGEYGSWLRLLCSGSNLPWLVRILILPFYIAFQEPRNRFQAWRAGTTTLFVVQARQASWVGGIDSSDSIPGLLKCLQIRAQVCWSVECYQREAIEARGLALFVLLPSLTRIQGKGWLNHSMVEAANNRQYR